MITSIIRNRRLNTDSCLHFAVFYYYARGTVLSHSPNEESYFVDLRERSFAGGATWKSEVIVSTLVTYKRMVNAITFQFSSASLIFNVPTVVVA